MEELIVIPVADLKKLIQEVVRNELNNHKGFATPEEILNSESVMKFLGIKPGFLLSLRAAGLPHYKIGNGTGSSCIRYKKSEVLAFMDTYKK